MQASKWHASQQLSLQKDGSLLAEFRLSSMEEIKRWLLGFGRQVVAIEPETLREELAAELCDGLALDEDAGQVSQRSSPADRRRSS